MCTNTFFCYVRAEENCYYDLSINIGVDITRIFGTNDSWYLMKKF